MARYPATPAQPAAEPPFMVETSAPQRESKIESEVLVPLFTSGISALVVMVAAGGGAVIFGWPWEAILVSGILVLFCMWAWRGVIRSEALLWTRETITQRDINRDGSVGKPHDVTLLNMADYQPPARTTPTAEGGTETKRALLAFVLSCYAFNSTSERAHGIQPWQRKRYLDFRDALMMLGIADWKNKANPRLGWEMVAERDIAVALIEERVL